MHALAPSWLLALDPGLNRSGVALFQQGELWAVKCVSYPAVGSVGERAIQMGLNVARTYLEAPHSNFAAEWPQIYDPRDPQQKKTKGDPNSNVPLAAIVGACAAAMAPRKTQIFKPSQWKGQVPKSAMKKRIVDELSAIERARIPTRLAHDGYDAVGIGLYALGRLFPKKVIDRE